MTEARPGRRFEGDLQQLRSFYFAATLLSFTRAAERLSTGQPSVSNHVKQLERLLGVSLFDRHGRGVTLTEAGRALLDLVAPVVEGVDRLPEEMGERLGAAAAQEVRLAAGQELLLHLVAPLLPAYRGQHPDVRLVVFGRVRDQVHALVVQDDVDFGIAARAGLPGGLSYDELLADELVLIAPPRHDLAAKQPATLAEIARYPLLMPDASSSTRRAIEQAFAQAGLELRVAMELERWHVIKEFVALDQGVALVPRFSVAGDERRLAVRRVAYAFAPLSYGIVTRRGRYLSPPALELIDAIRGQAARATR